MLLAELVRVEDVTHCELASLLLAACWLDLKFQYFSNEAGGMHASFQQRGRFELGARWRAEVIYHPSKFRNRLPFELQCSATTHFDGFVEPSSLPLYLGRFGGRKEV